MGRITAVALAAALVAAAPAQAFDPAQEALNFAKGQERFVHEQADPAFQAELRRRSADGFAFIAAERESDPDRMRVTLCSTQFDGCSGDPRLLDWAEEGHGIAEPVQYVNRNGAVITATVWAPHTDGSRRLPAVVITPGSVQAPQGHYLYIAQTLAQAGYVVLTYDVQGQGRSDTPGSGPHQWRGVPSQQEQNFTEGTEEALDFLLSTPERPYVPRLLPGDPEDSNARAKQARRVEEGRGPAHNPLHELVDPERVGIAGHSLGASAVSKTGIDDDRVDAIVAWDNLSLSSDRTPRVPALGMAGDYGLVTVPNVRDPARDSRNAAFERYRAAGVDAMQVNIRGGTHFEFSFIPNPAFTATLRGLHVTAWYTTAWFDKYVKGDPSADARLLSDRFRDDPEGAHVDAQGDGNLFSFYSDSPVAITTAGGEDVRCDDLRAGCDALVPKAQDGWEGEYSYLEARKR